jgi:ParB-like nuclease domain
MRVDLQTLQPNPMRDFQVDPMSQEIVDRLKESIEEDGFWGGIICRKLPNGTLQIGAGHHRVAAALEAGYTIADVTVREDLDDTGMIRVYARENATQRGNAGTAPTGAIASTVRMLAKAMLTDTLEHTLKNFSVSQKEISLPQARGHFLGQNGMGREIVSLFLQDIPGMNTGIVQAQLALLKESGHYDRIIQEVKEEIEREHQDALERAAQAQRLREEAETQEREAEAKRQAAAAEAKAAREEDDRLRAGEAAKKAQTEAKLAKKRRKEAETEAAKFDALRQKAAQAAEDAAKAASHTREVAFHYDGVSTVFTNGHQLGVFRELVTSDQGKQLIAYEDQPAFARQIKAQAEEQGEELTGEFIRRAFTYRVIEEGIETGWSSGERRQARKVDRAQQVWEGGQEFARHMRGLTVSGQRRARLLRPRRARGASPGSAVDLHDVGLPAGFRKDLDEALEVLTAIRDRLRDGEAPSPESDPTPPHPPRQLPVG